VLAGSIIGLKKPSGVSVPVACQMAECSAVVSGACGPELLHSGDRFIPAQSGNLGFAQMDAS
jgi:hypothetical protein